MTEALLDLALSAGLPLVGLLIVLGCLGVPAPSSVAMLFAGALVASGDISYPALFAVCLGAAVLGDNLGFALGRWLGGPVEEWLNRRKSGGKFLKKARKSLNSHGNSAIFLSRWLFTPVGPYLNLLAGSSGYSWRKFLIFEVLGELVWVLLYTGLGVVFSAQVQMIADLMSDLIGLMTALAMATVVALWLRNRLRKRARKGLSQDAATLSVSEGA